MGKVDALLNVALEALDSLAKELLLLLGDLLKRVGHALHTIGLGSKLANTHLLGVKHGTEV